jgi:hypothetical protein
MVQNLIGRQKKTCKHSRVGRSHGHVMSLIGLVCKCGILARKGVVPSELGYGWYSGNSCGDYWVKSLS